MVIPLIKWYHCILAHPGQKWSRVTIQARYYHQDIWKYVNNFCCDFCWHVKIPCKGMGLLPECNFTNTPWYEIAVDLVGPWTAKADQFNGEFYALTCIDTTTNLVKLTHINTKSSDAIARKFKNTWLAWYPQPAWVVHNNGNKFTGYAFANPLCGLGIKDVSTTNKNPQSNAICEPMHQTMAAVLKTLLLSHPPQTPQDVFDLVDDLLATTMHSMRSTISTVLKASPGALAFSHDMLLNIPLIAGWQTITCNRETLINDELLKNY